MPYTTQEIKQIWSTVQNEKDWSMTLDVFGYLLKYFRRDFNDDTLKALEKYGDLAHLKLLNNEKRNNQG
jgi:hypothetical protein